MALALGDRGIDFAFMPSGASYSDIARNGGAFVSRYCAGYGGAANRKTIRSGEIKAAVKAHVDFAANFELSESTPTEGAASGKRHGLADRDFLVARGYAPHAGVAVSWEPGNDKSQWTNVARFLAAYRDAVQRPIGMYAGLAALLHFRQLHLIDLTWLPMASSASGIDTSDCHTQAAYAARMEKVARDNGINLCQNRNRWYGVTADENVVTTMPAIPWTHLQALASARPVPRPQPTPQPHYPAGRPDGLVAPAREWAYIGTDDGRIDVRHDGKHARYI